MAPFVVFAPSLHEELLGRLTSTFPLVDVIAYEPVGTTVDNRAVIPPLVVVAVAFTHSKQVRSTLPLIVVRVTLRVDPIEA